MPVVPPALERIAFLSIAERDKIKPQQRCNFNTHEMESRLTFSHSQLAQTTTFEVIASKLGVPALSEEQKDQVRFVFGSTLIMNEGSWSPENEPRTLDVAVSRCQWFSDRHFRLKVYGEFAQVLNPHFPYDSLPRLSDQAKDCIKSLFLAVLLDDSLVGHDHLGCLEQALRWFMDAYSPDQEFHHHWARIEQERSARWSMAS